LVEAGARSLVADVAGELRGPLEFDDGTLARPGDADSCGSRTPPRPESASQTALGPLASQPGGESRRPGDAATLRALPGD
jgi:hypothetical protein